jgi:hypothetical protein
LNQEYYYGVQGKDLWAFYRFRNIKSHTTANVGEHKLYEGTFHGPGSWTNMDATVSISSCSFAPRSRVILAVLDQCDSIIG